MFSANKKHSVKLLHFIKCNYFIINIDTPAGKELNYSDNYKTKILVKKFIHLTIGTLPFSKYKNRELNYFSPPRNS